MSKKIGIVFSGGGVRGAAHLGVLKAFEEAGIQAEIISGVSAGAITGAFYAAGYSAEETYDFLVNTPLYTSWSHYTFIKPGVLDSDIFSKYYHKYFPEDSFESLEKSLYIATTDLVNVRCQFFNEGPLIQRILASCAFPFVFSPVQMEGSLFSDGGIINNFPVEPLIGSCDYIIGIFLNPVKKIEAKKLKRSWKVIERALFIKSFTEASSKLHICDMVICPDSIEKYSLFDKRYMKEIYELGYETGKEKAESILLNLNS